MMKREYEFCTEHLIAIKDEEGENCPQCKNHDHVITVVAADDLKSDYRCGIPEHVPSPQRPTISFKTKNGGHICSYVDINPHNGMYDPMCGLPLHKVIPWADKDIDDLDDEDLDDLNDLNGDIGEE